MTQACYNPLARPDFFAIDGDCATVLHDMRVTNGELDSNVNDAISAILIQLNTDGFRNGERGFWGDEFLSAPIGSQLWTITGTPPGQGVTVRADQMIRQALEPLIDQGLIDDLRVEVTRTIEGLSATVDALKGEQSIFGAVFNG